MRNTCLLDFRSKGFLSMIEVLLVFCWNLVLIPFPKYLVSDLLHSFSIPFFRLHTLACQSMVIFLWKSPPKVSQTSRCQLCDHMGDVKEFQVRAMVCFQQYSCFQSFWFLKLKGQNLKSLPLWRKEIIFKIRFNFRKYQIWFFKQKERIYIFLPLLVLLHSIQQSKHSLHFQDCFK